MAQCIRLSLLAQADAMPKGLYFADYAIIAVFFAVMLFIGFYYAGRMHNLKDYFSGGRQVPWWLSGASLWMTSFSVFSFVAYSELAYKHGFVAVAFWWFLIPCPIISAYFFSARWRRAASTSPLEFIEVRYGRNLRQGLAWLGVPMTIIDDGTKLYAIGIVVASTMKFSIFWSITLCALIMLVYTFLGGLWAVMITDFVQFVVMLLAVIVLVPLALNRVEGLSGLVDQAPKGFFLPFAEDYTPLFILAWFVVQIFAYCTRWSFVQRYYSVPTDKDARKVGYLVALLGWLGPPIFYMPAMAARIFMPGIENTREVYALLCKELLPIGMVGMVVAAMFSATMSTLSGDYNAVAAVMTNDIYRRLWRRKAGPRALVLAGRISTLLTGLAALIIAYLILDWGQKGDLFKIMAILFSILLPPIAIPMMFGLISRRMSSAGGLGGFLCGAVLGIGVFLLSYRDDTFTVFGHEYKYAVLSTVPWMTWITTLPTILGMYIFSSIWPNPPECQERIKRFLEHGLEETKESGWSPEGAGHASATEDTSMPPSRANPFPIIGMSMSLLGGFCFLIMLVTIMGREQVTLQAGKVTLIISFIMFLTGLGCWLAGRVIDKRMENHHEEN